VRRDIEQLRATAELLGQLLKQTSECALDEFDAQYTLDQLPQVLKDLASHLEELPEREKWPR